MRAGAERAARVDHDLLHAAALGRLLPRRAHVEPAGHQHREVEALPALVPVVGHLLGEHLDERLAGTRLEGAHVGQLARRTVDRVLDDASPAPGRVTSSTPLGRDLQQLREHRLRLLGAAAKREPDQRAEGVPHAVEEALVPFGAG